MSVVLEAEARIRECPPPLYHNFARKELPTPCPCLVIRAHRIAFTGSFITRYLLSTYYVPGQCSLLVHIVPLNPHSSGGRGGLVSPNISKYPLGTVLPWLRFLAGTVCLPTST